MKGLIKYLLPWLLTLSAVISCDGLKLPAADQKIVIDGEIEDGGYPIVKVTATIPVSKEYTNYSDLKDYVLNWAKVTVSGPEGDVVLTGRKSEKDFPPYIFTTTKMKGRAGEKYKVRVDYGDESVEAETTIPSPVELAGFKVEKDENGYYRIIASLKGREELRHNCRFFVKVEKKDSTYLPSFMGLINSEILPEEGTQVTVCRGMATTANEFKPYYEAGDVVHVKFVTMDEISYLYWSDYEDLSTFSRNPFFPSSVSIRSNISGGLGLWAGYGATKYIITIPSEARP